MKSESVKSELVIRLMTTLGCHLCDDAMVMLQHCLRENKDESGLNFIVEAVEITDTEVLVEQYGIRIPVLIHSISGQELAWPFNMEQLRAFLHAS